MPSPFPGVDPYLESQGYWPDLHSRFVNYWCEAVADILPDNYEARIDERVSLVELPTESTKEILPDVAVVQQVPSARTTTQSIDISTLQPVTVPLIIEEETYETYIRILHRPDRSLVAVLEMLSPSNKHGSGRETYLVKRNSVLNQYVHLVELDLLLDGERLPMAKPLPPADYYALISRGDRRPDCQVYAWAIQQPLPTVPIPLKSPDPDLQLDLGAVFTVAYERGRYARSVQYDVPPKASVSAKTREWILERARNVQPGPP